MRDIPSSPRVIEIKRKRRLRKWRRFILSFFLFISIIYALSYFSNDKHITIDKFSINGIHILNPKDIESVINKDISGKYIYLFTKSNSFIYPHNRIYNDLISQFPRIEKLSLDLYNFKTLNINIVERLGSYLYCGVGIPEKKEEIGENCYFINNDGYIFDKAPYFSGNVYFKYYMALSEGEMNPLGKQMISMDKFHELARFIDGVTSMGFKPIYIYKDNNTDYLYLDYIEGKVAPRIIFKNDDNLEKIQDNLLIAMRKKEFADEINSKYNTLLYIDLRFDNKVLYKFE